MKRALKRGFTLIELMIVVAILGILAAVAIPAFIKYMSKAKTSEATTQLKAMHDGAAAYFNNEWTARGMGGVTQSNCVPGDVGPTPDGEDPSASKFAAADWQADETTGFSQPEWISLRFSPADDFYYVYEFVNSTAATGACNMSTGGIYYRANGDLDGDGDTSLFERAAQVTTEGLNASGGYYKIDPLE